MESDTEEPDVPKNYRGWDITVEKDSKGGWKAHATYEDYDKRIYETVEAHYPEENIEEKIDQEIESMKDAEDYMKNYETYMGLDEDPDWFES